MTSTGEYLQNRCIMGSHTCTPCQERLPSCVLLSDGRHCYPGRMWLSDFIVCYKHRTTVERCEGRIFNPNSLNCEMLTTSTTVTTTTSFPTTRPVTAIIPTTSKAPDCKIISQFQHFHFDCCYSCWLRNDMLTLCNVITIYEEIREDWQQSICILIFIHNRCSHALYNCRSLLTSRQNWLIYDKTGTLAWLDIGS